LFEYLFRVHIGAGGIASAGFLVKYKDERQLFFQMGCLGDDDDFSEFRTKVSELIKVTV
jgi:hypothetical protein